MTSVDADVYIILYIKINDTIVYTCTLYAHVH